MSPFEKKIKDAHITFGFLKNSWIFEVFKKNYVVSHIVCFAYNLILLILNNWKLYMSCYSPFNCNQYTSQPSQTINGQYSIETFCILINNNNQHDHSQA